MKRTPLVLLLLILATATHADIIIFRGTLSVRRIGNGEERLLNERTFLIADVDGTNATGIETVVIRGHKLYHVEPSVGKVFGTTVRGANGRVYRITGEGTSSTNAFGVERIRGGFSRGLQTKIPIRPERVLEGPRVSRFVGSTIEQHDNEHRIVETTATRVFANTDTQSANARGDTVESATARLVQKLEAEGYINSP